MDEQAAADAESMTKEEREGKKKILPRTRSGRVSKPPRHMVKDYKRLHHLDFAQPDLDDSDGGYSDYRIAADQEPGSAKKEPGGGSTPGIDYIPTSPFHCTTCKREYTTPLRLSRHFEQFPDHKDGQAANGGDEKLPPRRAAALAKNGGGAAKSKARDDEATSDDADSTSSAPSSSPPPRRGRGRGGWRGGPRGGRAGRGRGGRVGRPPAHHSPTFQAERRKLRLAESLEKCVDEEVVEVAGPRLSAAMTSWEYLLLRVQQEDEGHSSAPLIPRILNELMTLAAKVSAAVTPHMRPSRTLGEAESDDVAYELNSGRMAALLELPIGTYFVSKADDRHLLGNTGADASDDDAPPKAATDGDDDDDDVQPLEEKAADKEEPAAQPEVKSKELWEELEEASHSLHSGTDRPDAVDQLDGVGHNGDDGGQTVSDAELMQVRSTATLFSFKNELKFIFFCCRWTTLSIKWWRIRRAVPRLHRPSKDPVSWMRQRRGPLFFFSFSNLFPGPIFCECRHFFLCL